MVTMNINTWMIGSGVASVAREGAMRRDECVSKGRIHLGLLLMCNILCV